jgi:tripartite-type tricarboxylate transporter receptor subunit TctC
MKVAHFARLAVAGIALLLAPFGGSGALAQTGPIRFIVGLAPGGAVDPYARIIAEHMAKTLGRSIIVENRQARPATISAQFMIDAPADGQLIWVGTQALTEINPSVFDNLRWKIDDFLPLIKGVQAPLVFAVHPDVRPRVSRSF